MSLRHAVLGLLADGPASGYDLLKRFEISLANVWPATQSQLYGELGKMADEGLVEVMSEGPRGRKEYAITEPGRTELRHWLVNVEPTRVRRSDQLLRVFFLHQVSPEEAEGYLRRQGELAAEANDQLTALSKAIERYDDNFTTYGRLALEWGLRFSAMQREWSDWAIEQVKRRG